ncbi:MAG TPA: cytochrome c3 family protein, partial [Polyangiaceae bacterium]
PESGEPLNGSAPHARDTKGCLSCHDSGPPGLERGAGHAFRASGQQCAACHEQKVVSDVRERALELRAKLAGAPLDPASGPSHATLSAPRSPSIRVRALYDVELVLEDPAAATHNPAYAKLLLDAAQPFASTSARGGKP